MYTLRHMEVATSSASSVSREGSADRRITSIPLFPDSPFDLVVVAGSYGAIPALREIMARLPPSFCAPIAVVQHIGAYPSNLADFLDLRSRVAVRFAADGERLRACTIVVAPPDKHLIVCERRRFRLSSFDKVNFTRPAADPLFDTASKAFGPRTLAVVLSGMGRDGAEGLRHIREVGGWTAVQDEASAVIYGMPRAAAPYAELHIPLAEIGNTLAMTSLQVCRRR